MAGSLVYLEIPSEDAACAKRPWREVFGLFQHDASVYA
jgi:hypothetical protein